MNVCQPFPRSLLIGGLRRERMQMRKQAKRPRRGGVRILLPHPPLLVHLPGPPSTGVQPYRPEIEVTVILKIAVELAHMVRSKSCHPTLKENGV